MTQGTVLSRLGGPTVQGTPPSRMGTTPPRHPSSLTAATYRPRSPAGSPLPPLVPSLQGRPGGPLAPPRPRYISAAVSPLTRR